MQIALVQPGQWRIQRIFSHEQHDQCPLCKGHVTSVNQIASAVFSNTMCMSEDLSKVLTIPEQCINCISTLWLLTDTHGSFKKFPELAGIFYSNCCTRHTVNKEMHDDMLGWLTDAVQRKRPQKNAEPTVRFSYTTIPQHTRQFKSRISWQGTM